MVKAEQGLLAYDVMTIKDYGMTEFLKNGMYSLNREKEISRYYKVKGTLKNGKPIILYPFSKQYDALEMKTMIKDKGFKEEVPEYLIDFYNGNYEECEEYKEVVNAIKDLKNTMRLKLENK